MVDIKTLTAVICTIASVTSERIPNVQTKLKGQDAIAFTSLLQNILKVNKDRMDSIKTLFKKQELPAYHQRFGRMRADQDGDDDSDSSDGSEGDVLAYLVLPQGADLRSTDIGLYTSADEDGSRSNRLGMTIEDKTTLRKNEYGSLKANLRSCSSKSIKRCKAACREAISNACATYSCKSKLKKSLKKECKRSCKSEFRRGGRYDTDDDW